MSSSVQSYSTRPGLRGRVIGLGMGQSRFVGSGVGVLLCACLLAPATTAMAAPEGAKVRAGQARIVQRGNTTIIRAADRTIIDYSRFDLSKGETVRFVQPGSSARVLNRISGEAPTHIDGTVRSNGIVYFANRAGVVFGPNSVLNVGGLYAAAGNISDNDFQRGNNRFTEVSGSVINQGVIDARVAVLVGQRVRNSGVINAPGGLVAMVAGSDVVLSERNGNFSVKVDAEALGVSPEGGAGARLPESMPGVENSGRINAGRGKAMLVAGDMYSLAVKNSGTIRGRSISLDGRGAGRVEVSGQLNASNLGPRLTGGEIAVTGESVDVRGATIDASGVRGGGSVRVGGEYLGGAGLRAADTTTVDAATRISADATVNGDGGTIIVWSDNRTDFYGTATARGGVASGDGGLIETSGKVTLDVRNAVVRAESRAGGVNGLWLLDPVNVNIEANPTAGINTTGGPTNTYSPTGAPTPAIVDVASVIAALESGTNVTITTGGAGSPGTDAGNINVNAPIALSNAPGGSPANPVPTLTLIANNNITVNQSITTSGAALPLNVTLNAQGGVDVGANITTGGGNFAASGTSFVNTGTITTAGGNAQLTFSGNVNVRAAIDAAGGAGSGFARIIAATLNATGGAAEGIDAAVTAGTGGVQVRPFAVGGTVNVATGAGGLNVSEIELGLLRSTGGTVEIGRPDGTGPINIGAATYSTTAGTGLRFVGGEITLGGTLTINNSVDLTLGFAGSSLVDGNGATLDVDAAGAGLLTLALNVAGNVGSSGTPLSTDVDGLNVISVAGNLFLDNARDLATGSTNVTGNIRLRNGGQITSSGAWTIGGTTELVTLDDAGNDIVLGNAGNSFGGAVTLRSRQATDDTLLSAGDIVLVSGGNLVIGQIENSGGGSVELLASGNITQAASTSLVFGGGGLDVRTSAAGQSITLDRVVASGDVFVSTSGAGSNVSITTLNSSGVGLTLGTGSASGGSLTLVSGAGNLVLPSMVVGGPVSLTTSESNATISTGLISGTSTFTLNTTGASGDATLDVDGPANITAAVGGLLSLSSVGNLDVTSAQLLRLNTSTATGGDATFTAPDIDIDGTITAQNITLLPDADTRTVNLGSAPGADFQLTLVELQLLSAGTVTIGRSTGTGTIVVNHLGAELNLASTNYDLIIRGGALSFDDSLRLADDRRLTLRTAGITGQTAMAPVLSPVGGSPMAGPDVVIGGSAGELVIESTGAVDMLTDVARLAASITGGGSLSIENLRDLSVTAIGGVTGISTDGGGITLLNTGNLSIEENIASTGAGSRIIALSSTDTISFLNAAGVTGSTVGLTATNSIVGDGSANVRVTGNAVTLTASNGAVGSAAALRTAASSSLTATAGTFIDVNNAGSVNLRLTSVGESRVGNTGTLTFTGASSAESYDITATDAILVNADTTATGPTASRFVAANGFTVGTGSTLSSTAGPLSIEANDLFLDGQITTGTRALTITRTNPGSIGVGDASGDMVVSKAELGRITAGELTLGGVTTTLITVSNVAAGDLTNIGFVTLNAQAAGADVTFSSAASTFRGLSVLATDTITVGVNLSLVEGGLGLRADSDGVVDTGGDRINIGSGVTISTIGPANDIALEADTISGSGAMTITSNRSLTLTTSAGTSAEGNVTLSAKGPLTLNTDLSGSNITLSGDNGIAANGNITSVIGSGSSIGTPVSINADADADGTGLFSLATGRTITTNGSSLSLTAGDVQLDGSINAGTAGLVTVQRGGAGSIGIGTASGDLTLAGDELSRIAAGALTIGGATTTLINVDSVASADLGGVDDRLTLVADDFEILGALSTGDVDLTITRATAGFITLGSATGGLSLSNTELALITAPTLTIGSATAGNIVVAGLAAGDTANIDGVVSLLSGGTINFTTAASSFKSLVASANNGVNVSQNLTTTVGDLSLNGDSDGTVGSQDGVSVGFNRTISSAGKLTLRATNGGASSTSGATLLANNGIDLLDGFGSSGLLTINADNDADGTGVLLVSTGRSITTGSNNLAITASDLTLDGSIDTGSGSTTIARSTPGSIGLGTGAGDLSITGAELQRIATTGLTLGGANTGTITVGSVTGAQSNTISGVLTLLTGNTGAIVFNGASTFNALSAQAGTTLTVNSTLTTDAGALTLRSNTAGGAAGTNVIALNGNVTAPNTQDVRLEGNVVLGANVTVAGNDLTFTGSVNSDSTRRSLTLNSFGGGITRLRNVGDTSRLFTLTTNSDGRTVLNGTVRTTGTTQFFDRVLLAGDTVVDSSGGLGVTFASTVDSAAGGPGRSLTVLTRRNTSSTAKRIPLITFAGRVGARRALSNLYLNYDPANPTSIRANVPAVATIVARPLDSGGLPVANPATPLSMSFTTTGDFRMGRNEKLSTVGALTINAAAARLGDINTLGDLNVNAPSIVIQRRAASRVLGGLVTSANPTGLSVVDDRGVDFVSGGRITFSTPPTAVGAGAQPSFGSANGAADMSATLAAFLRQRFGEITRADFNRIESSGSTTLTPITLDLISSGPTDAPLATTLAGAIPRESRTNVVGQDSTIAQAQIDELRNLGVFARNPSSDELVSLLGGAATYDDVPRKSLPTASDYTTVVSRLPADRVEALLQTYNRVFNKAGVDENGKQVVVNRSAEIQAALLESVRRYRAARAGAVAPAPEGAPAPRAGSFDPLAFRAYLENTPEESVSLGYIRDLGEFLSEIETIGLTPRELAQSKAAILNPVRPRGIPTVQLLEAVIKGEQVTMAR